MLKGQRIRRSTRNKNKKRERRRIGGGGKTAEKRKEGQNVNGKKPGENPGSELGHDQ